MKTIQFENNKGEVIDLPANTTVMDLVNLGVKEIKMVRPEEPLLDGWYRDAITNKTIHLTKDTK